MPKLQSAAWGHFRAAVAAMLRAMRWLLVEDDRMIGAPLREALRLEGHAVAWVYDARAADG